MRDCNAMDCGTCERWPSTLCVGPVITRVSVSRMLEICMSGSMRGSGYRRSLLDILRFFDASRRLVQFDSLSASSAISALRSSATSASEHTRSEASHARECVQGSPRGASRSE